MNAVPDNFDARRPTCGAPGGSSGRTCDRSSDAASGPQYVDAVPAGAASSKALGVTCAFFGMVVSIGALAAMLSGRLHGAGHSVRGVMALGMGMLVFLVGAGLLERCAARGR